MIIKNLKTLAKYLKGYGWPIALAFLCAVVATTSKLLIPFFAARTINAVLATGQIDTDYLLKMIFLMAGFILLGLVFRYIFDALTGKIAYDVSKGIRKEIIDSYLRVPVSYLDKQADGDILLRLINGTENVQTGLVTGGATLFNGVVAIVATTVFMFALNWLLGILAFVLTPLSLLTSRFVSRFNSKHFRGQAKRAGKISGYVDECLTNSETIRNFNLSEEKRQRYVKENNKFREDVFKASMGASIINPASRLVNSFIYAALLTVGAVLLTKNVNLGIAFGIGDLTAFLVYASNYADPFNEVADVVSDMSFAFASLERIELSVNAESDVDGTEDLHDGVVNHVTARNLNFSYEKDHEVLHDLCIDLERGKRIALVGATGSGKTTTIQLIARFYDADTGDFYFDDAPSKTLKKKSIRKRIGMVLQYPWIFHGTVAQNIAYGKPLATREQIEEAAKRAYAHESILALPQGYDTPIDDDYGLSLGQKQLIAVARVLLMEPEIIILDEAMSNIDVRTEALLNRSFDTLLKDRTSLVVAHRLSTIVSSDVIYALRDGRIVEHGTHKELLAKGGYYHELYMSQFAHGVATIEESESEAPAPLVR